MESNVVVEVHTGSQCVLQSTPLWEKELAVRSELGSEELMEDWFSKLVDISNVEGSYSVLLLVGESVVACAMVCGGFDLHHNNLATVFGMVAEEGYGAKLLREVIKVAREQGYKHLHVSTKLDLKTYRTKVLDL